MKYYSLENLQSFLHQPLKLKQEIMNSKGFILSSFENNDIFPSLDLLMETINPYSIRFIKKHYIHLLDDKTTPIVLSFLEEEKEKIVPYTEEELKQVLFNNEKINLNKLEYFVWSFDFFKSYKEQLIEIVEDKNEIYSYSIFSDKIFSLFTDEEILSLGKDFLIQYPFIFNMKPNLLRYEETKKIYKEGIYRFYINQSEVSHDTKIQNPQIMDFKKYCFNLEEKDFLIDLLKNTKYLNYDDYNSISNFNKILSPLEYFEKIEPYNINYLSSSQLKDNEDFIREKLLLNINYKYYHFSKAILFTNVSQNDYMRLINEDFFIQLIEKSEGFNFLDRADYTPVDLRSDYINNLAINVLAKNPQMTNKFRLNDLFQNIEMRYNYFSQNITPEYWNNISKIMNECLEQFLSTNNIFSSNSFYIFTNNISLDILKETNFPKNVNSLYFLLSIKQLERYFLLDEKIDNLISSLPAKEVETVAKIFNYNLKPDLLNQQAVPNTNFNYNFLQFENIDFDSLDSNTIKQLIIKLPQFREYILNNNFNLWDKSKNVILFLLQQTENKDNPNNYYDFLKQYIFQNENYFKENYIEYLVSHPLKENFITLDTTQLDIKKYNIVIPLLEHKYSLFVLMKKEKNNESKYYKNLKKQYLEIKTGNLYNNISFNFIQNKIKQLLIDEKYHEVSLLINDYDNSEHNKLFIDYIGNMSYEKFINILEIPSVFHFIDNNKLENHKKAYTIKINPHFSNEQNLKLYDILLNKFKDLHQNENHTNSVLGLFHDHTKTHTQNFIIKNDVLNLLTSYSYIPSSQKNNINENNHVLRPFSNEEIIEAFHELKKQYNSLYIKGNVSINHNFDYFLQINFSNREEEYKKLCQHYKKNDPEIYLLLSDHCIFQQFTKRELYKNIDRAVSHYYYENFDLTIIEQGIIKLLTEWNKENQNFSFNSIFSDKVAYNNLIQPLMYSYDKIENNEYFTYYNQTESESLVKLLWENAPLFLLTRERIGTVSIMNYLDENFDDHYYDNFINNFIFLNKKVIGERNVSDIDIEKILFSYCDYLISNKKHNEIDFIIHCYQEAIFNRDYRHFSKSIKEFNNSVMSIFSSNEQYYEYLVNGKKMILLTEQVEQHSSKSKIIKKNKL